MGAAHLNATRPGDYQPPATGTLSVAQLQVLHALSTELKEVTLDFHASRFLREFMGLETKVSGLKADSVREALSDTYSFESDQNGFTRFSNVFHLLAELRPPLRCFGNSNLVPALLACGLGSHLNAFRQDAFREETPLGIAIQRGNTRFAYELLRNGADPRIDSGGQTIVHLANAKRDSELIKAIRMRMFDQNVRLPDQSSEVALPPPVASEANEPSARSSFDDFVVSILNQVEMPGAVVKAATPAQPKNKLNELEEMQRMLNSLGEAEPEKVLELQRSLWKAARSEHISLQTALNVVEKSELKSLKLPSGLSILGDALINGQVELAMRLFGAGVTRMTSRAQATYQLPNEAEPVSEEKLTERIMEYMRQFQATSVVKDAIAYFAQVPSPYQLFLYFRAVEEAGSPHPNERGLSGFQVASNLLYVPQHQRQLSSLLAAVPKGASLAGHRNESEVLLLLNESPEAPASQNGLKMLDELNLTENKSAYGVDGKIASSAERHWALSRIGSLTYSFSRLRFDAMSTKVKESDGSETQLSPGLLASFGGECIPNSQAQQRSVTQYFGAQPYGSQFFFPPGSVGGNYNCYDLTSRQPREIVRKLDDKTTISARQGYYLVSNPERGCLIVRNSSPEFGRLLMTDSALYLDREVTQALSTQDVKYPSPQMLNSGVNPVTLNSKEVVGRVNFLIDELQGFLQLYRQWKFDTSTSSAWQDVFERGQKDLVGAHLSPGFRHFVSHLRGIYEYYKDSNDTALALAFVHPDFPSWRQFEFSEEDGARQRMIPVDEQVLRCLEHLADGKGDERELQATGLRNFVQQAGLDKQAELMIMSY